MNTKTIFYTIYLNRYERRISTDHSEGRLDTQIPFLTVVFCFLFYRSIRHYLSEGNSTAALAGSCHSDFH